MANFKDNFAFRSSLLCRKRLEKLSRTENQILFGIGLKGCSACHALRRGLERLTDEGAPFDAFISKTSLMYLTISEPEQLSELGMFPLEFPTLLWIRNGKVIKGWASFPIAEDRSLEQAISRHFLTTELISLQKCSGSLITK
jgi:hypothetical protein